MPPAMRSASNPPSAVPLTGKPLDVSGEPALLVQGLRKQFRSLLAVDDLSFNVPRGHRNVVRTGLLMRPSAESSA
jgi:hypothetical protein